MNNFFIGIVTKDRYVCLDILLHSLRYLQHIPILVIDVSDNFRKSSIITNVYHNVTVYRNELQGYKAVVHNKNIIIHNFLKTTYKYLFIIEDDMKVLDCDVFQKYIDVSEKYNIPHMNFGGRLDKRNIVYNVNDEIQIFENLQGCFSFYNYDCLKQIGLMNPKLCHNCWEHVEHTARIHRFYNYQPNFYHFPDINKSYEYLKMQDVPSTIPFDSQKDIIQSDKELLKKCMGWKSLPYVSIKRFNLKSLRIL